MSTSHHSSSVSRYGPSGGVAVRKSTNSAFGAFLRPAGASLSAIASTSTSSVSSPSIKNALSGHGGFLNELQKLQLDLGEPSLPPSATPSGSGSSRLDASASPNDTAAVSPAVDALKLGGVKLADPSGNGSASEEDASMDEELSDRGHKPLHQCTLDLLALFRTCNPRYNWSGLFQPRRVLTSPSVPSIANPNDNANNNLIMSVGDILWHNTEDSHVFREKIKANSKSGPGEKKKYQKSFKVMELLGEGTFGQVVKCEEIISLAAPTISQPPAVPTRTATRNKVFRAIKVIKNKPAYYNQALMEIQILRQLNEKHDPENKHHLLRMVESFNCKGHLCLVFELLSVNLYDLMKQNGYRGLSWSLLRIFLKQILDSLSVLTSAKIIHCDLKPENILLNKLTAPDITLIDFGSACFESQTVYSYIQSRFYRAPEVLIGLPYNSTIDAWSFGCIAAELYLGLPLFPGITQQNQLHRMIKFIGPPPPLMLAKGKNTKKFFRCDTYAEGPKYTLKTAEEYAADTRTEVAVHKTYFKGNVLKEVVDMYPMRKGMTEAQKAQELEDRKCFLHFLQGFLRWDATTRWLPKQALQHPFLQRQPLSTFNEQAFEQLRYAVDKPPSIPPTISAATTPAAATTAPTAAATTAATPTAAAAAASTAVASSGAASTSSSTTVSASSSAASVSAAAAVGTSNSSFSTLVPAIPILSPSNKSGIGASTAGTPVTTVGAALLTNQELAIRHSQQQQQAAFSPSSSFTASSSVPTAASLTQQQQLHQLQLQHLHQSSSQTALLASAILQQQQQQQQQSSYGTSPQGQFYANTPAQSHSYPGSLVHQSPHLPYAASQPQQIQGAQQRPSQSQAVSRASYSANFSNPAGALFQQQRANQQTTANNINYAYVNHQQQQQQAAAAAAAAHSYGAATNTMPFTQYHVGSAPSTWSSVPAATAHQQQTYQSLAYAQQQQQQPPHQYQYADGNAAGNWSSVSDSQPPSSSQSTSFHVAAQPIRGTGPPLPK